MNKKCWAIKGCVGSNKFPRILFTTAPSYQKFFAFYSVSSIWHVQGLGDITTERMEGRIETGVIKTPKRRCPWWSSAKRFDRLFRGIPPSMELEFWIKSRGKTWVGDKRRHLKCWKDRSSSSNKYKKRKNN